MQTPRSVAAVLLPVLLAGRLFLNVVNSQAQSPSMEALQQLVVYPSMIVYNGKIATIDATLSFHEAMAIRGNRIWKLGTNQEIRALAGPDTLMVDVKGRTVVPGLVDAHTHPHLWAWHAFLGDVVPEMEPVYAHGKDLEQVRMNLKLGIQQRIQKQGKDQWVLASVPFRYKEEIQQYPRHISLFPDYDPPGRIRRSDLETIAPDTPVVLISGTSSGVANNTARQKMIQALGYEAADGVRLSYDFIWGVLLKGRSAEAEELVVREMREDFLNQGVTTFASHGQTNTEFFRVMGRLDREGTMPMRFGWSHESGFFSKDPEQYYRLLGDFLGQGSDFLWNVGVGEEGWDLGAGDREGGPCVSAKRKKESAKESVSGVYTTLATRSVYKDCVPSDSIEYREHLAAAEAGLRLFDVHNSFGDKVMDRLFALAEDAIRSGNRTLEDIREQGWEFDHNGLLRPDQIPLIKKYGFQLDFQGSSLSRRLYVAKNLYQPEYLAWVTPVKSVLDAGIKFNLGTDTSVLKMSDDEEDFFNNLSGNFPYRDSIWPHIGAYVQKYTEVALGEYGSGNRRTEMVALGPEQRIDRISALKAATIWGAEMVLRGDRLGSLEPGKLADFAVIDKDYFTVPEPEIMQIKTLMTGFDGKIVYKSPNF